MKKLRIYKTITMLTMMIGIALMVTSCGHYGRGGYGRPYGYGYNYPRPYRYAPRVVVVQPRYCPPPRRGYYGNGYGRGRRW